MGTLPESVVNLLVRVKPLFSLVGGGNLLPFLGGLTRPSKVFSPCELRWLLNLNSSILSLVLFEKAMLVVYVIMVQYSTTSSLRQLPPFDSSLANCVGLEGGEETDPESDRFGVDQP